MDSAAELRHRPWSTALMVLLGVSLVPAVAALVLGGILRFGYPDGDTEGISSTVGAVLLVLGSVGTSVDGVLLGLLVLGRRRADAGAGGTLFAVAVTVAVLALAGVTADLAWGLFLTRDFAATLGGTAFHAVLALPYVLLAARTARGVRPPRPERG